MARRSDWDVFLDRYQPIEKYDNEYLFETYGKDLDKVRNTENKFVWTIIDGFNGKLYLIAGYHIINRIGYLLTKKPFKEGKTREYLY